MTSKNTSKFVGKNKQKNSEKEITKPLVKIPKNTYDPTKGKLWKQVVEDILTHFAMVGEDGIPVFKSMVIFPSDYNTSEFTYGFARNLCSAFEELEYYTDIECEDFEVKNVIIGIEPIGDKWDF